MIELPPGSTLFLYTDGLNEAADPEEKEFERLRELSSPSTTFP